MRARGRHYPHSRQYRLYIQSKEWREKRKIFLSRTAPFCEKCGREFKRLEVHHKHYRTLGNERHEDVDVLCQRCHRQEDEKRIRKREKPPERIKRQTAQKRSSAWARRLSEKDQELVKEILRDGL